MAGESQGTEGFKVGNLRRYLPTVALFNLVPTAAPAGMTARVWLTGLKAALKLGIAVGMLPASNDLNNTPFAWPTGGGTLQLYPVTKFPDAGQRKVFLRPVFQDPTVVTNTNHPLPQELPFGWEGAFTTADEIMIEVIMVAAAWTSTALTGTVVAQVVVEYNGAWWDIAAIEYTMGRVNITGGVPANFGTGGGG